MCLVHRGDYSFTIFFASQFHYKGLTCCCTEAEEPLSLKSVVSITCEHHSLCLKFLLKWWTGRLGWRDKSLRSLLRTYWANIPTEMETDGHVEQVAADWKRGRWVLLECTQRLFTVPVCAAATAPTVGTYSRRISSMKVRPNLFEKSHIRFELFGLRLTESPPCSLSVWMAPSDAHRHMQARWRSPRGADTRSGAQENQTPPHHFHRGAAGRTGRAVPAESVSRCEHKGETGTEYPLKRRTSGGESVVKHGK